MQVELHGTSRRSTPHKSLLELSQSLGEMTLDPQS